MKTSIRTNRQNTGHAGCMALGLCLALGVFAIAPAMARADNYVTSSTTRLSDGTWIVEGRVTVSGRINIASSASVSLRLNEGATLNAEKGIYVRSGTTLTIEGAGTLNATGSDGGAGIGGAASGVGTIIINGGTINATGSVRDVGNAKMYGPAIGGDSGLFSSGGSVSINGGQVTATGVDGGVGIGGDGMTVTLGWTEASDFIETTSFQGTVGFAEGKQFFYADTDEIVTSLNLRGGRLLPLRPSCDIVVADAENGNVTADKQKAMPGDTVTLTANSSYPYVLDSLTVVTATGAPVAVERIDRTTCRFVMPDEDVTATPVFAEVSPVELTTSEGLRSCLPVLPDQPSFDASVSEWYAVTEDTTLQERLNVAGEIKLYLCGGTTLTCEKGLRVEAGNGLTIEGEGALVAQSYSPTAVDPDHAAIGSNEQQACGNIEIRSGTVTATGSIYGAAIGAGYMGNGGSVTITGGKVTAIGGEHSPGIGASYNAPVVNTEITLGWTEEDDFIECNYYYGPVSFVDDKEFLRADNLEIVTVDNLSGGRIIPKLGDSHSIVLNSTGDGVLSASSASAVKDAPITLSWTTTNRYVIPAPLTVKDGQGHDIDVEWTSPSFASFVMPDDDVTVTAAFEDVGHVSVTTSDGVVLDCRPITPHLGFSDYEAGNYAVTEDTTIGGRVVIGGDVMLYLCEGTTLTCGSGISVVGDSRLTVEGGGSLVADARDYNYGYAAGIGGANRYDAVGTVTINGGSVTAYGGSEAAGIGGGSSGSVGTLTINWGMVHATGGSSGAGIGGGSYSTGGMIVINGGQVTATGGQYEAGIGRGYCGTGGSVTLGWTTATDFIHASSYAADVAFKPDTYFVLQGTGELATLGNIGGNTIVPLIGGTYAITENPGAYGRIDAVYADGTDPALRTTEAPAGFTVYVRCSILDTYYYEREVTGLTVTGSGGGTVEVTALGDGVFQFLMPADNVTLTPQTPEIAYYDVRLVRDGRGEFKTIQRAFNDSGPQKVVYSGTATEALSKARAGDTVQLSVSAQYPYYICGITVTAGNGENVVVTNLSALRYEFVMPADTITATIQTAEIETIVKSTTEGGQTTCLVLKGSLSDWTTYSLVKGVYWFATTEDTTIPHTIHVEADVHVRLYLSEGTTLICPGIFVDLGATLTIEGEGTLIADASSGAVPNEDPLGEGYRAGIGGGGNIIIKGGDITAKGDDEGAGIGGDELHIGSGLAGYSGDVTISGGTIHAIGGLAAAGIGGNFKEICGVITISGGKVDAVGGAWGAGIGGGLSGSGGDIRISGGVVNALGVAAGAGIGGGYQAAGGTITISGGTVTAQGGVDNGYGAGIGAGSHAVYGTSTVIRITGGQVTARGGWQPAWIGEVLQDYYAAGIGLAWNSQVGACDITLGWTEAGDYVDSDLYYGNVAFAEDKFFKLSGTYTLATTENIDGVRIVPALPGLAFLEGDGTGDAPWLIRSERDWKMLCDGILGGDETSGKSFRMTADISVTNMIGALGHSFAGTFDGGGHVLTVAIADNVNECVAPFSLIDGATIANLAVAGSVSSTKNHAAGLVGSCGASAPNVIRGCVVDANVTGGSYQGGIVGHGGQGELTLEGCVFGGTVSGFTAYAGGLMGWCNSMTLSISNCLVKGTFAPGTGGLFHPIACKRANQAVTATVSSAYYLNTLASTVIDGFSVPGAEGIPVSATYVDGEWTRAVTAADGLTYYRHPTSSYAEWAAESGIAGAWNEKDGDGVANVFRYAFDVTEGTDGMRILDLTFNDQGQVVVQTPPVVNSNGFGLSIATADDPAGTQNPTSHPLDSDGETVIDEPETGSRTRFYRLKAAPGARYARSDE